MKVSESKAGQRTITIPKYICNLYEIGDGDVVEFVIHRFESPPYCEFRKVSP